MSSRRTSLLSGLAVIAAAAALAPAALGADPPRALLRARLKERLHVDATSETPTTTTRFRLDLEGVVNGAPPQTLGVRVGDLSLDVALVRGRFTGMVASGTGMCRARVRIRGGRLVASFVGLPGDAAGSVFAADALDVVGLENERFHGLRSGNALFDGDLAPLAFGFTGLVETDFGDSGDDAQDVSVTGAALPPRDTAS